MARENIGRLATFGAAAVVIVVILLLLFTGGSSYVIHAQFSDAGQLVKGDEVTVAGHKVGSVTGLAITKNGLADVTLSISDKNLDPLSSTSTATIGQLSLTGVANRFVSIAPGSGGRPISNGGTLPSTQTKGIVDLDTVLDSLTPKVRRSLQQFFKTGAYFVSGHTPADFRDFAEYLNPALSQLTNLGAEVVSDKYALDRLVGSGAKLTSSLAANTSALQGSVSNAASVLSEVAGERTSLADVLERAPGVFRQSDTVLGHVDTTLTDLNPTLVALKPVAPKVASLLRAVVPFAHNMTPTVAAIRGLLPQADTALTGFPAVGRKATPAIQAVESALSGITPILSGLRPYVPDFVAGFFNGVAGATGAGYDANGHYLRARLVLGANGSLDGALSLLGNLVSDIGVTNGGKFTNRRPCPGGGTIPSADGSAPWTNPDSAASLGALCTPGDDQGAS